MQKLTLNDKNEVVERIERKINVEEIRERANSLRLQLQKEEELLSMIENL